MHLHTFVLPLLVVPGLPVDTEVSPAPAPTPAPIIDTFSGLS